MRFVIWLVIASGCCGTIYFYARQELQDRGLSNAFGALAVVAAIAAVMIWISKRIYVQLKKRTIPDFDVARQTLIFFRRHHILLGWAVIATGVAHGVYYLLRYPNRVGEIYTGLASLAILLILAFYGIYLDFKLKDRKKTRTVRSYHIALGALFLLSVLVHAGG